MNHFFFEKIIALVLILIVLYGLYRIVDSLSANQIKLYENQKEIVEVLKELKRKVK